MIIFFQICIEKLKATLKRTLISFRILRGPLLDRTRVEVPPDPMLGRQRIILRIHFVMKNNFLLIFRYGPGDNPLTQYFFANYFFPFSMLSKVILLSLNFFPLVTNMQSLQQKSENKEKKFYRIGYWS